MLELIEPNGCYHTVFEEIRGKSTNVRQEACPCPQGVLLERGLGEHS